MQKLLSRGELFLAVHVALPNPEGDPDQTRKWVRAALSKVDPNLRAILELRELQGKKRYEVARELDLTLDEVERLYNAALDQFKVRWRASVPATTS